MASVLETQRKINQSEVLAQYNVTESPQVEADLHKEADTARRMFDLPAELFGLSSVVLCSIWPQRMESQIFTHAGVGRKIYTIEAGSLERPSYLILQNTFDLIIQQQGTEKGHYTATIPAASYGNDIIRYWTGDHPGNRRGKKGIGIIKGHAVNGLVTATPAELANLNHLQTEFLSYLVERADQLWDGGKREQIGNEHKRALKILGQDISQHPWFRSKIQMYNDCPECYEPVKIEAISCRHCSKSIPAYFMERDEIPDAVKWPRVVQEIDRLTKKKKTA